MYRLLVIESKITNICLCRTGLDTLAESEISDQKDGDKEEEGEKPQQGNYHLSIIIKTESLLISIHQALIKPLDYQ